MSKSASSSKSGSKKSGSKKSDSSKKATADDGRPSYLGLLNAIAVGEGQAHTYLNEWVELTENEGVRETLKFVALREGEHALAFEKRMLELGYELRPGSNERLEEAQGIVRSNLTDRQKFKALGLQATSKAEGPDIFSKMFENKDIDPVTGGLLGRYVAEERDSGRRLRACYDTLA
jgi:rubrerythrin